MTSEDFTHAANDEILEAFIARHGFIVEAPIRLAWSILKMHTGIMLCIKDQVSHDDFKVYSEAVIEPMTRVLSEIHESRLEDAKSTLDQMVKRYVEMMEEDDG